MRKRTSFWIILVCMFTELSITSQNAFLFDSTNILLKSLKINTDESEFSPFKIGNTFYFTSSKERKVGVVHLDESSTHQMLDIYKGQLFDSITVKDVSALTDKINNSVNQGSCFFDVADSRLYYSGDILTENHYKKYKLAIFSSEFKDNEFLEPKIELVLADTFSVSHPMIYNGKLYFSSNLPGGKGKTDIYYAEKIENQWLNLKNYTAINTPENEYFPYVINDNEIYFSSNRPGGFGNLDLYKYTRINVTDLIQNLGKPINSKWDDFGIYTDSLEESGYFASNRKRGQDDIYFFKQAWPIFKNCTLPVSEDYCYNLTEESTLDSDSLKGYYYQWSFGDGIKEKGLSVRHCFPGPANYLIKLNIIDSVTKAVFMSQASFNLKVDSIIQLKINCLDTVLLNKKFIVNTDWTYLPDNKITGYYFEIDGNRVQGKSHTVSFSDKGIHKIKLGVTTFNLKTKRKEVLCTTKEINCVEPQLWKTVEKRKINDIVSAVSRSYLADSLLASNFNYDVENLKYTNQGLNGLLIADELKKIIDTKSWSKISGSSSDNTTNEPLIANSTNPTYNTTVMDTLMRIQEGANISFKVHLGTSLDKKDTSILNSKGIYGTHEQLIENDYHYTYGNEKKIKDIEKYYTKTIKAGVENPFVVAYKNDSIIKWQNQNIKLATFDKLKEDTNSNITKTETLTNLTTIEEKNLEILKQKEELQAASQNQNVKDSVSLLTTTNLKTKTDSTNNSTVNKNNTATSTQTLNNAEFKEYGFIPLTDAQKNNQNFLEDFGDLEAENLEFKVQVGVFKERTTYDFPYLKDFGTITSERLKDGSTRMTLAHAHKTLRQAVQYNKKIVEAGQTDAFVSVYYNGMRIGIENLKRKGVLVKTQVVTDSISETKLTINASNLVEYAQVNLDNGIANKATLDTLNTNTDNNTSTTNNTIESNDNLVFVPRTNIQKKTVFYAEKYGNISASGLEFKVQIAVFKYRNSYSFPKLKNLGKIETEAAEEGATRMTIGGSFPTLNEALALNKKVVIAGQTDAFVSVYYEGKRVYFENLERRGIFVNK